MSTHQHAHAAHGGGVFRLLRLCHRHGTFDGTSARRYDLIARTFSRRLYRRLADDITIAAPVGSAVLDVGTGPGVLVSEIARRRPDLRITGVDVSADMIEAARRNVAEFSGRASVEVADVAQLPFADESFDVVVTSFSLHHWDDVGRAVGELVRVLRPGGRLVVYDFVSTPLDTLDSVARESGKFEDGPVLHSVIRTAQPHIRRCARHVLFAAMPRRN